MEGIGPSASRSRTERSTDELRPVNAFVLFFILKSFMLKYNNAPVAQRIEQARPKGEMQVRFPPGVLFDKSFFF